MVSVHIQLASSTLRKVIKRLHYPLGYCQLVRSQPNELVNVIPRKIK
jgi:hypothetical protein